MNSVNLEGDAVPGRRRVLRYFDCRGRGQALRFALQDRAPGFEDERIANALLPEFKRNAGRPGVGGPFGALPVLDWDGYRIAQTLAIARYLGAKLGCDGQGSAEQSGFLDMILSAAHLDLQMPYGLLFWQPADRPEADFIAAARLLAATIATKLGQVEAQFATSGAQGPYFGGAEPAIADYFVYESLSRGHAVFGEVFERRLRTSPRLQELKTAMESRPGIAACLRDGRVPNQVTASPNELLFRTRLASLDLTM